MILRTLIVSVVLATIGAVPGTAQVPRLRPAPSELFRAPMTGPAADPLRPPRTYWMEGALITGIPFGVFGYVLEHWGCVDTDSGGSGKNCVLKSIGGFVVGALIGAVPGALIGGQFEKH